MEQLRDRLAAGEVIVLDGGTGSEIEARGAPMDGAVWSALANVTHPDVVRSVHEDYIRAGADVVIANTFAAGPGALAAAGLEQHFVEVNNAAVRLAREARERVADRPVVVAGSLSVMAFEGLESRRSTEPERIRAAYRAQAAVLAEAGVDLLVLEMMSALEHARPALEEAVGTGLPVWLGVSAAAPSAGADVKTVQDVDLAGFVDDLLAGPERVEAVLVMHTDIHDTEAALDVVVPRCAVPIGAYPHKGTWRPPHWELSGITPDEFAARVAPWRHRGVRLLGGCCGIRPEHIAALAAAVGGTRTATRGSQSLRAGPDS
jgi:S-methylmethionine-dependent homocysteine/selenocysteine methylase